MLEKNEHASLDEKVVIGKSRVPTQFICGKYDNALLCNRHYNTQVRGQVSAGNNYVYRTVECGHDVLKIIPFRKLGCLTELGAEKVKTLIMNHIKHPSID